MPIPAEYATSNPVVRDALAAIPLETGAHIGGFVAPDFRLDYETVDAVTQADHNLDLDDLRAPDALAKEVRFDQGSAAPITVVERAQKSKMDTRTIEDRGKRGIDIVADRAAWHRKDVLDAKEYRIAQLVTSAANFTGTHKDVTGLNFRTADLQDLVAQWSLTIVNDGGFYPKYAEIGTTALRHARRNAAFREWAGGSDTNAKAADLSLENLAAFLGLAEIREGFFTRKIGNATTATQFWPTDSFLLFSKQDTISNRTFAATAVVPYGPDFAPTDPLVDVRTAKLQGIEGLSEVGAFHRYRSSLRNALLGFLVTGVIGT